MHITMAKLMYVALILYSASLNCSKFCLKICVQVLPNMLHHVRLMKVVLVQNFQMRHTEDILTVPSLVCSS